MKSLKSRLTSRRPKKKGTGSSMAEPPPPPLTFDDNISTIAAIDYTVTPPTTPQSSNNPKRKRIKSPFFKKRKGGSTSKSKSSNTPKTKTKKGTNTPSSLTELEQHPSPRKGNLLDLGKSSQALEQEHANLVQMLTPLKDLNKLRTEEDHSIMCNPDDRDPHAPVSQTTNSQRSTAGANNGNGAFKVLQAGVLNRKHRRQFRNKSKSPPTVLDSHNATTLQASIASPPLDARSESPVGEAMLSWSTVGPRSSSDASIDIGPSRSGSSSSSIEMAMTQNDWNPMTTSPERRTSARERRSFPKSAFDPADSETTTAAGPKRRLLNLLEGAFSKEEEDKDKEGEDYDDDEGISASTPRNSVLKRILGKGGETHSNFNSAPPPNLLSLSEFTNLSDQERLEAFESITQFASQTYTELNDKQSKASDLDQHAKVLNQQVIQLESMNENSMQNQNLLEKEMEKLQEVMKGCAQSLEAKVQFLEEEKEDLLQQVQQQQEEKENKQMFEGGEEEIFELRQEVAEKTDLILTLQRDLEAKAAETELKQEEADILKKEIEEHRITITSFQPKTYPQSKADQGSSKIDTGKTSNPNADEEQSELRVEAIAKTRSLKRENEKEPQTQVVEEKQQRNAMSLGICGESDVSTSSDDINDDGIVGVANDKEDGGKVKEKEQEEYYSNHKVMEANSGCYETSDIEGATGVESKGNVVGQQYENIPKSDQSYTADSSNIISPEVTSSSCEETSLSSIPSGETKNVLNTSNQNDSAHIVLSHEQAQEVNEKQEQDADVEMQESRQTAGDKLQEDSSYPKQIDSKSDEEHSSNNNVAEDDIPTASTEAINFLESDIQPSIDASKSLDSGLDGMKQRNHTLDIKMPVGTTRASVAIAAARAMKNTYAFNGIPKGFSYMNLQGSTDHVVSKWKEQKLTRIATLSNVPTSPLSYKDEKLIARLRDKRVLLEDMERSYKLEITTLTKEKNDLLDKRTLVEDMERSHALEITKLEKEKDELCVHMSKLEEKNNALNRTLNETVEGINVSTANILAEVPIIDGSELHTLREENVALCKELKTLKDEVESVNGLLEETMNAVKDDKGHILSGSAVPLGKRGVLGRFSNKTRISSHHSDEEVKQLERICKVHHHTIMHQRSEMQVIQKEREALLAEVRINEEKISAFEKQFIEFNKEQEQKRVEIDESFGQSDDSSLGNTGSEVIDQAYVSSLEYKSDEHICTIEELQNQLKVVKEQNDELRKEADVVERLKEELVCVNTKLQAKEMTISELEKCYESSQNLVVSVVSSSCDDKGTLAQEQGNSDESFASSGEQISDADLSERGKDTSILNLHKVTVLQEMQDAAIRRLDRLLSRIAERTIACSGKDEKLELMVPLCEKLSLMQDYVKVSLHLLEGRLSNEIESARSGSLLKMDDAMQVRFDRIHDLVQGTESQIKGTIKELEKEVQHQDIKISAKDTIIEGLILSKTKLKEELESVQTEIDIFKGLQSFSSVNIGVMSRFKECSKLEEKLKEKDEIINHLRKEIDDSHHEQVLV